MNLLKAAGIMLCYEHRKCDKCLVRTPFTVFYEAHKGYIIRQLQCAHCGSIIEEMVRKEEVE
jgi:hypothetical protein